MKKQPAAALSRKSVPIIYNLFPRHYKTIADWQTVIPHVADMGFNWIFVNPFHATGFSGSLYAIKNYYQLNPLFCKNGQDTFDWKPLKQFIAACSNSNINMMMDLVINHTAFDSVLVKTNPEWYKHDEKGRLVSPHAIDPANADNVTVWGDLAEIDNIKSKDAKGLRDYWDKLICHFQEMGVLGFRCDAAYQVPGELWKFLIAAAKKRYPRTVFLAETLGCSMEQIAQLKDSGFDFLFNSSKYWEFDKPWCIEQHELNKSIAPSISFPESHDTARLASEKPGTEDMQKMRYAFAALFSAGILMPEGYEYGATIRIDVVNGTVKNVDEPQWDLSNWIKAMNLYKMSTPVLSEEGTWHALVPYESDIMFLEKQSENGGKPVLVVYNKDKEQKTTINGKEMPEASVKYAKIKRVLHDVALEEPMPAVLELEPNELVFCI